MRRAFEILRLLSDGDLHSGEDLALSLGITRAAVWNQIRRLRTEGLSVVATAGGGYQLGCKFEGLDSSEIEKHLKQEGCSLFQCRVEDVIDSTNTRLLLQSGKSNIHRQALFAEFQTIGRGRRGDKWVSPPGSGICFSLGYVFDAPPATFSALSLVVGISLIEALKKIGVRGIKLKWPNDIVRGDEKVAGILIEMRAEASGASRTVIGIGLNFELPQEVAKLVDRPIGDLGHHVTEKFNRNQVAAKILHVLGVNLLRFETTGFVAFHDDWRDSDALSGQNILLALGTRQVNGVSRGVDKNGALLLETNNGLESFLSGHLTVV
ncbi:MAG: biotin--[acetyl-CoA-carboxylase] ligase [Gammaproteobacteria bacterium]|nr:biotin--[acetyl-CoA-carboxylase] ligase [Gammaproteobacteria bacterium]